MALYYSEPIVGQVSLDRTSHCIYLFLSISITEILNHSYLVVSASQQIKYILTFNVVQMDQEPHLL